MYLAQPKDRLELFQILPVRVGRVAKGPRTKHVILVGVSHEVQDVQGHLTRDLRGVDEG